MPIIDGVEFTEEEYREVAGDPGPDRPDFEQRGYRDNYPDSVQDQPGYDYHTDGTPDTSSTNNNPSSGNEYPGSDRDRQGPGGQQEAENRAVRERQARDLNASLGIDGGNLESFLSGRANYEEYLKDQSGRAGNTPGYSIDGNNRSVRGVPAQSRPQGTGGGNSGGNNNGGNSLGNWSSYQPFEYTPFTEQFVAPTAPTDLMTPWTRTFTPTARPADLAEKWDKTYTRPTATDLTSDPGYLARMTAAEQAAERSAAARGTLLTGGFQKGLAQANQDYASNEYQRLADRSLGEYMNAFQTFTTDKGRRAANADTIFGQELSGYQTDFNTDQADKARRGAEFGNTYNRSLGEYGQRFSIDQANQLNKYGVVTGNFGMGRQQKMDDFSIFDTNRAYDANRADTAFNQNRSSYLDDFGIWSKIDDNWWNRNGTLGSWGQQRPS